MASHAPKKTKQDPVSERAVIHALQHGPRSNKELRTQLGLDSKNYDPRLDRTLQQLRKEGKIHIVGQRWAHKTVQRCPTCEGRGWVEA